MQLVNFYLDLREGDFVFGTTFCVFPGQNELVAIEHNKTRTIQR